MNMKSFNYHSLTSDSNEICWNYGRYNFPSIYKRQQYQNSNFVQYHKHKFTKRL